MTRITSAAILTCLAGALVFAAGVSGREPPDAFVLIVHEANPVSSLRRADASKLFLRKRTTWPNGKRVDPVDLVMSSPTRRAFSDEVHDMDVPSVKSYWQELVFAGRGEPPPERASDAEVVAFVRTHVNGLGYVSSATVLTGVKAVALDRLSR